MLGIIEKLDKQARKFDRYAGGAVELPEYPGSVEKTYKLLYPKYLPAPHLKPLREAYRRAKTEPVRICCSFAPRAGKTETVIAGKVDRLLDNPMARMAYVTATGVLAKKKSARIRSLARGVGVPIDPSTRSKQDWATGVGEGGLWATSVDGSIVGMGFELITLDDLIGSREDAESVHARDKCWDFVKNDAQTRLEPEGAIIMNGTRWHADDPIGRAIAEGYEEINVPALDEHGNSYWARRWTTAHLIKVRDSYGGPEAYEWCSLYMGNPRAQGERLFKDATFADGGLPPGPCRVIIGVDFAYTTGKSSDYSAAVVIAEVYGVYYVVDVYRAKEPEAVFRAKVAELAETYHAAAVVGYVTPQEQANVTLMQRDGLPAYAARAIKDKKTHALPTAAAWNLGRIKVLRGRAWERPFLREVEWFTGADLRDDMVDALCTGFDALWSCGPIDWDWINSVQSAAPMAYPGLAN